MDFFSHVKSAKNILSKLASETQVHRFFEEKAKIQNDIRKLEKLVDTPLEVKVPYFKVEGNLIIRKHFVNLKEFTCFFETKVKVVDSAARDNDDSDNRLSNISNIFEANLYNNIKDSFGSNQSNSMQRRKSNVLSSIGKSRLPARGQYNNKQQHFHQPTR